MKRVYLDYAAATPVRREVLLEMRKYGHIFANPSSVHALGVAARELLESVREKVGKILGAGSYDKIIFTAGGTESINLALLGVVRANTQRGKHIITSSVEHKAVLETCKQLEKEGFSVDYVGVDSNGMVNVQELVRLVRKDTILISIQYVNNETGIIQSLSELCRSVREKSSSVIIHTDACQAGLLDLNVKKLGVDLLTLNSSKIYGPHGVGMLYIRDGVSVLPLMLGGGQEYGLRSGTENVEGVVGFVYALGLLQKERGKELRRLEGLRKKFVKKLCENIDDVFVVSDLKKSMPGILSVGFLEVEAETLVKSLSVLGVYVSAGSACTAQQIEVSHVLRAMRVEDDVARGVIRFSLGRGTMLEDLQQTVMCTKKVVESLRKVLL